MLNNLIVAISGGVGRIGSVFSKAVVENGGKVIIGDINTDLGNQLVSELGDEVAFFFEGNLTWSYLTEPESITLSVEKPFSIKIVLPNSPIAKI